MDFEQRCGDLDVRQDHCRLVNQHLRGVRHRRIQRCGLQTRLGDDGVRQVVGLSHVVDGGELRFQQHQPVVQVLVAGGGSEARAALRNVRR